MQRYLFGATVVVLALLLPCSPLKAQALAPGSRPQPSILEKTAQGEENYRVFTGVVDAKYTATEQNARRDRMKRDLLNAILSAHRQGKLDTSDPTAGVGGSLQHAFGAGNPLADLGSLMRDRGPPAALAAEGNYYAKHTVVFEKYLIEAILNSKGKLTPVDVLNMSLEVTDGNFIDALLTVHNLFKNAAYKGREQIVRGPHGNPILQPLSGDDHIVLMASKLANLRANPEGADKYGPWYHMYGVLFLGSVTNSLLATKAAQLEQFGRRVYRSLQDYDLVSGGYSPMDHEKKEWDEAAIWVMWQAFPVIFWEREPPVGLSGTEEPILLPGMVRVKVLDEDTHEPLSGAKVMITFPGKSDGLRTAETDAGEVIFKSLPGEYHKYQAHVSLDGYRPSKVDFEVLFGTSETVEVLLTPDAPSLVLTKLEYIINNTGHHTLLPEKIVKRGELQAASGSVSANYLSSWAGGHGKMNASVQYSFPVEIKLKRTEYGRYSGTGDVKIVATATWNNRGLGVGSDTGLTIENQGVRIIKGDIKGRLPTKVSKGNFMNGQTTASGIWESPYLLYAPRKGETETIGTHTSIYGRESRGVYLRAEYSVRGEGVTAVSPGPGIGAQSGNVGMELDSTRVQTEGTGVRPAPTADQRAQAAQSVLQGQALGQQQRHAEAELAFRSAVHLDPYNAVAHFGLGSALARQGRWAEAEAAYAKAAQLDPSNVWNHYWLGWARVRLGKWRDCEADFQRGLQVQPNSAACYYGLGLAQGAQSRWKDAESSYRQALKIEPSNAEVNFRLCTVLQAQLKAVEAERFCRVAVKLNPSHAFAHDGLGNALFLQNRLQEAEAAYHTALSLRPRHGEFHANLAGVLYRRGRIAEARREARQGISLGFKKHWVYPRLGLASP